MPNEAPDTTSPPATFEAAVAVAFLETDAICEGCRYSLRGQAVKREPHTGVLMVRCPECARFTPATDLATAGRLWLNRFSTFLVMAWLAAVLFVPCFEVLICLGICMGVAPDMHYYHYYSAPPGAYSINNLGWPAHTFLGAVVALYAFILGVAAPAIVPHWRRVVYIVLSVARTGAVVLLLMALWPTTSFGSDRDLLYEILLAFTLVHGLPSLVGSLAGRRLLRVVVRVVLPARLRPAVAYLWTTDGLEPPRPGSTPRA